MTRPPRTSPLCLLHFAALVGLTACDGPAPAADDFWRPWYDVTDLSEPDSAAGSTPDLATPVDALPPPRMDLAVADLAARDLAATDLATSLPDLATSPPDLTTMPSICSLAVSVTTTSAGGRYSPRNIGAIWVSDDSDHFIKSLNIWADKRVKNLKRWTAATSAALVPGDRTDAISGATKTSHGLRTATWNCTDTKKLPVADGSYKVCFELTDYDGQGPYDCVAFTKGLTPLSLTPVDSPSFTARKLDFTP